VKPIRVALQGPLGEALDANRRGRLSQFIVDETSPAIALFDPARRAHNREGDWYGEHAGKWLYAAAKAIARSDDAALAASVRRVADHLLSVQEADGYLGTYAPDRRFMQPQPPKPPSWDGAPSMRTWDVWTHAYLILGLIEAARRLDDPRYLDAARRIGDLCRRTLIEDGIDITELGNHFGLSATVLIDPATELYFATGDARYLELAEHVLRQADAHPDLALLTRAHDGFDASEIATGKAYQLAWNLVGLAKLHRATGDMRYREAVNRLWHAIGAHHLTLGGGPWGGVAHRSREVFNPAQVFSPHGYVETCSTLAWIQLNRELLAITGDARYAAEIERSAYNDLLGAQAPNGEDWCYYVFPNGRRVHTTYWRCCKSSGAMALEELPDIAYGVDADGAIVVRLFGASVAEFESPDAGRVRIEQRTRYPFDGDIALAVSVEREARYAVRVRVPAWAEGATLTVGGAGPDSGIVPGGHAVFERVWRDGDTIDVRFPMRAGFRRATHRNVQESRAPDGDLVRQEVLREDYAAIVRGPLVYATGLIDGYKTGDTVPRGLVDDASALRELPPQDGEPWTTVALDVPGREPLRFVPYFAAGGRRDGAWRITWLSLAPDSAPAPQEGAADA
jgi:DUF1680 family protein